MRRSGKPDPRAHILIGEPASDRADLSRRIAPRDEARHRKTLPPPAVAQRLPGRRPPPGAPPPPPPAPPPGGGGRPPYPTARSATAADRRRRPLPQSGRISAPSRRSS